MATFWASIGVCVLMMVLFETDVIRRAQLAGNVKLLFILSTIMQLTTICVIPLALRLFKFKGISQRLTTGTEDERTMQLCRWGLIRQGMFHLPMLLNLLFYYLTGVDGFAYMAIILALSLCFIYPSLQRCLHETHPSET